MEYTIAIVCCSSVIVVVTLLIIFGIVCRKKNKCKTNDGFKGRILQNEQTEQTKTKLFWSRFAKSSNESSKVITVNVAGISNTKKYGNKQGRAALALPEVHG